MLIFFLSQGLPYLVNTREIRGSTQIDKKIHTRRYRILIIYS